MVSSNNAVLLSKHFSVDTNTYFDGYELKLAHAPISAMLRLQISGSKDELNILLPQNQFLIPVPKTFTKTSNSRCFWITPNEFVFDSETFTVDKLEAMIRSNTDLSNVNHLITDISDARVVFRLSGARAEDYLSTGSALDFTLLSFPVGSATITRFYALAALIARTGEMEFDIMVDRSLAPFVLDRLKDAYTEFTQI